jgi:hypothetical protein
VLAGVPQSKQAMLLVVVMEEEEEDGGISCAGYLRMHRRRRPHAGDCPRENTAGQHLAARAGQEQ